MLQRNRKRAVALAHAHKAQVEHLKSLEEEYARSVEYGLFLKRQLVEAINKY